MADEEVSYDDLLATATTIAVAAGVVSGRITPGMSGAAVIEGSMEIARDIIAACKTATTPAKSA
jgi:hypothetical protein